MWNNFPTGSWSPLDHEMPQRIRQTSGAKESMLTVLFSPTGFLDHRCDAQDIAFTVEYFIVQVLTPLHQHRMSLSEDAARRRLNLHFDNSGCHTVPFVIDKMAKLRCKRVAYPPYFHDLAICDFYLFSRQKNKLAGFHADDDAELLREVQGILIANDRTEVKKLLGTGSNDVSGPPGTRVNTILNSK
jgi:hypothetical protein